MLLDASSPLVIQLPKNSPLLSLVVLHAPFSLLYYIYILLMSVRFG